MSAEKGGRDMGWFLAGMVVGAVGVVALALLGMSDGK